MHGTFESVLRVDIPSATLQQDKLLTGVSQNMSEWDHDRFFYVMKTACRCENRCVSGVLSGPIV